MCIVSNDDFVFFLYNEYLIFKGFLISCRDPKTIIVLVDTRWIIEDGQE